jgi:hypothetical protein
MGSDGSEGMEDTTAGRGMQVSVTWLRSGRT